MTNTNESDSTARTLGTTRPPVPLNLNLGIDPTSLKKLFDVFREVIETAVIDAMPKAQRPPEAKAASPATEPPPSPKSTGLDLSAEDRAKAADLRVALLMGKIPEDTGLLIDTKTLARLLDVSSRTIARLEAEEAMPASIQLGNLKKWRLGEILEWIEADCPPLRIWVNKRQGASKRKGR